MDRDAHEQNRRSWNAAVPAHNRHKGDQAGRLRAGRSTLFPTERALLGPIEGLDLAHLQCNCGQDSLSLALLGARVTGVDISDAAIDFARVLSRDSGVPASFVRADLHDFLATTPARFDLCFSSYGWLGWLSELRAWAQGLHRVLRPGGRFVAVEFHPTAFLFDPKWRRSYPHSSGGRPIVEAEGVGDYVAASQGALSPGGAIDAAPFANPHPTQEFAWSLGDLLTALIDAGLRIERFEEHPYANGWRGFEDMEPLPGERWRAPAGTPDLPLMFGLVARRP
jgi:SAM-dependent methyltransferase